MIGIADWHGELRPAEGTPRRSTTSFALATTGPALEARLRRAFELEPLEDGMDHPAESLIREALRSTQEAEVLTWMESFALDVDDSVFSASVLRCLGRQRTPGTPGWRAELLRAALSLNDVQIRDAAVQAAESWADREIIAVLEAHTERRPWLRDYVENVIRDLST